LLKSLIIVTREAEIWRIEFEAILGKVLETSSQPMAGCGGSTNRTIKASRAQNKRYLKNNQLARHRWLMPVILATQEAEIRKITA
jgi:hypothetical protein